MVAIPSPKQLLAHAGIGDECAHQQEHRNDAEGVIGHRAHRGVPDDLQRRLAIDQIGKAGNADQAHRHADRDAHQHQAEQHHKTKDRDGFTAHCCYSTGLI
jgi:hypothetical protein